MARQDEQAFYTIDESSTGRLGIKLWIKSRTYPRRLALSRIKMGAI